MALIIGLTGGIATGKSTVSNMFKNHGIPVIDTDKIAFDLLKKGTTTYEEVLKLFGDNILNTNGDINRKKLGKKIFNDSNLRNQLNEIIHPKIKTLTISEIQKYEELGSSIIVLDVPLLFETDFAKLVDKTVVVYTPPKLQIQRLLDRDSIKEEYALAKINSQISIDKKAKLADFVIDNSKSILTTKKEFNRVIEKLEVM